jgi:hypothetical protein
MKLLATCLCFVLLLITIGPSPARAQTRSTSGQGTWEALKSVPPGDELKVRLKTGDTVKGRFLSAAEDGLTLSRGKKTANVSRAEVARVYRLFSKSVVKSTLIGLGIGVGVGALIGRESFDSEIGEAEIGAAFVGAIGAGIGTLLGYLAGRGKREVLIYESN